MQRPWTEKEEELLRKFYPCVGDTIMPDELVALLNRSVDSIRCKAAKLGIKGGYGKENINLEILKQLEVRVEI